MYSHSSSPFHSARLKLTAWYLLIILMISLAFSAVIYHTLTSEIDRFAHKQRFRLEHRLEEGYPVPPSGTRVPFKEMIIIDPELVDEIKQRVLITLGVINVGILVISGGLGYFLAGRTLKPIRDMIDEQNRFISDASHELRTPLTSIKSSFEIFLRDKKPTLIEAKSVMKESLTDVNKLQTLSESLLQLAQYQKPNGHTVMESVSLNQILIEVIRKLQPIASSKDITIDYQPTEIEIIGNKYSLSDLFVILIDNAIKYSSEKSVVTILTKESEKFVTISVKDKGIGISNEDLSHIFDRFYRADSARSKSSNGGYGLGLSIAKQIVKSHGGSITVKSKVGKGSVFRVRLVR